ncbi:MAG: glycosyltransferase family 4 protein [Anaerolineae bacterium]|nr:glycosyltransferase family 4 protein [Anaerolineae bacterium]
MRVVLCQRQIAIDGRGGGLGTLYANIATALVAAGAAVTLVTATEPEYVGVEAADIVTVPQPSPDPVAYAGQVAGALDRLDFDLAECASWKAELSAYAARPKADRAPVVVRGELPAPVLNPDAPTLDAERALIQNADGILAVSQTVADLIQEHYGRPVTDIVHNAVDARVFCPDGRMPRAVGPLRALWVGSHAPIKRLDYLDAIIRRAAAVFDIVLPWLEDNAHIERFAAYPHVTLYHNMTQDDMTRLYRRADVLLSTSRLEAFGLGILEAMACGTPVLIPRDIGGAAEFVRDGIDGYYYASLDDAVARLASVDWRGFGDAMVPQARQFSWARCAGRTLAAYEQLLAVSY